MDEPGRRWRATSGGCRSSCGDTCTGRTGSRCTRRRVGRRRVGRTCRRTSACRARYTARRTLVTVQRLRLRLECDSCDSIRHSPLSHGSRTEVARRSNRSRDIVVQRNWAASSRDTVYIIILIDWLAELRRSRRYTDTSDRHSDSAIHNHPFSSPVTLILDLPDRKSYPSQEYREVIASTRFANFLILLGLSPGKTDDAHCYTVNPHFPTFSIRYFRWL